MATTPREQMLAEAARLTSGDRNASYGDPFQNLHHMAAMVTAYLDGKYGMAHALDAEDMAWIMVMAKISRTVASAKDDNYVDAAAYSAIAGECRRVLESDVYSA